MENSHPIDQSQEVRLAGIECGSFVVEMCSELWLVAVGENHFVIF